MKKLFIAALLFTSLSALSQSKDTVNTQRQFVLVMPENNWNALINMIKTADEKPSVIKQWMDFLITNLREIKTDSTKKK